MQDQTVPETRPNLPLLRKILDHIDAHPEEWNQADWVSGLEWNEAQGQMCGTAFCVAGHAVAMTEGTVRNDFGSIVPASGRYWRDAAADHLGLPHLTTLALGDRWISGEMQDDLFYAANTREDVQRIAEQIAADAGEVL